MMEFINTHSLLFLAGFFAVIAFIAFYVWLTEKARSEASEGHH